MRYNINMTLTHKEHKKPQPNYPDTFDTTLQKNWTTNATVAAHEGMVNKLKATGVTHEYAAKALKEQFEAMETKFFAHQGEVISSVDVINWAARLEAIKIYLAITGAYAPRQEKVEHAGVIVYRPDQRIQKQG